VDPLRVLVTANAASSHYYCMVPFAWALRAAGHEVRVAVPPRLADAVRESGLVAWPLGEDLDLGPIPRSGATAVAGTTGDAARTRMAQTGGRFIQHAGAMAGELLAACRQWRPDLVVHEPTAVAGPLVASALDVPSVCHRWGVDVGRAVIEAAAPALRQLYLAYNIKYKGVDSDFVVDPCPPSLQDPSVPPGEHVRYVSYGGGGRVPPRIPFVPGRPRVVLTMGTIAGALGGMDVVRGLMDVLLGMGMQVVIAVLAEQRAELGYVPEGAVALASYPLEDLIADADLVAHHGGAGTTMTCVAHGVPQLVVPYVGDSFVTAARIEAAGAGVRVPMRDCTSDRIETAVQELLANPGYREAAGRLRHEMRSAPTVAETAANVPKWVSSYREGERTWTTSACAG
jgi:UDP:flavonoid glycosyltransferase YjiC (YdhE family)